MPLQFFTNYLQLGDNPLSLAEWFIASVALVIVVTLIYVFVLNKSPPPEGLTEAKLELLSNGADEVDSSANLEEAKGALAKGDTNRAVELAVKTVHATLSGILRSKRIDHVDMNISDMAYLVQAKSTGSPDITQPVYQLNLLRLKVAQTQPISAQEAEWAVNTASWLSQLAMTSQIG